MHRGCAEGGGRKGRFLARGTRGGLDATGNGPVDARGSWYSHGGLTAERGAARWDHRHARCCVLLVLDLLLLRCCCSCCCLEEGAELWGVCHQVVQWGVGGRRFILCSDQLVKGEARHAERSRQAAPSKYRGPFAWCHTTLSSPCFSSGLSSPLLSSPLLSSPLLSRPRGEGSVCLGRLWSSNEDLRVECRTSSGGPLTTSNTNNKQFKRRFTRMHAAEEIWR